MNNSLEPQRASFRGKEAWFRGKILPTLTNGADHAGVAARFVDLLLLADRALQAAASFPEHGDLPRRVRERLQGLGGPARPGEGQALITGCLEGWLKLLLHLTRPDVYRTRSERNLHQDMLDLGLLTSAELERPVDALCLFPDPVRRSLFLAKEQRNAPAHDAPSLDPWMDEQWLRTSWIAMLAALDRHRNEVRRCLSGLICRAPRSESHPVLRAVADAWKGMADSPFVGRADLLDRLAARAAAPTSGYVLLTGAEGAGKTRLTVELSKRLRTASPLGQDACATRQVAPWLPRCLLHLSAWGARPEEILLSFAGQAEALLVEPPRLELPAAGSPLFEFRNVLDDLLRKLVGERGTALLVLDGLDEVAKDERPLEFLPRQLPAGVTVLLTSQPLPRLVNWACTRLGADVLEPSLGGLSPVEVQELTRVADSAWNHEVYTRSSGWPSMVSHVARRVRDANGAWSSVSPDVVLAFTENLAGRWQGVAPTREVTSIRDLLAIMEPVGPVSHDQLESWVARHVDAHGGPAPSREQILGWLAPLAGQLEQGGERVRMAHSALALHVRERCLGRRLADACERVARWLAAEASPDVQARFVNVYAHDRPAIAQAAARLPEFLAGLDDVAKEDRCARLVELHRIGSRAMGEQRLASPFSAALRLASDLGSAEASWLLAVRTLLEPGGVDAPGELDLLKRGEDLGDARATRLRGLLLLQRSEEEHLRAQGVRLLERAAEVGDPVAKRVVAERLLTSDPARGHALLREAAERDPHARYVLWQQDSYGDEAGAWLRRAAADHHVPALCVLASRALQQGQLEPAQEWAGRAVAASREPTDEERLQELVGLGARPIAPNALVELAGATYLLAIQQAEPELRRSLAQRAADALQAARKIGGAPSLAATNLAYLLRRREVEPAGDDQPIAELLRPGVAEGNPLAVMNLALHLISGAEGEPAWEEADDVLRRGLDRHNLAGLEWWTHMARSDDPEGHLVLGYLARLGLSPDPDGLSLPARLARALGWKLPRWFFQPAPDAPEARAELDPPVEGATRDEAASVRPAREPRPQGMAPAVHPGQCSSRPGTDVGPPRPSRELGLEEAAWELLQLAKGLLQLAKVEEASSEVGRDRDRLVAALERALEPARLEVGFVGEAQAGKSSLLNALLEDALLPSDGVGPVTGCRISIVGGDGPRLTVRYHGVETIERLAGALGPHPSSSMPAPPREPGADGQARRASSRLQAIVSSVAGVPTDLGGDALLRCLHVLSGRDDDGADVGALRDQLLRIRGLLGTSVTMTPPPGALREELERLTSGREAPLVAEVRVELPGVPLLRSGLTLVDLPGLGIRSDPAAELAGDYVGERLDSLVVVVRNAGLPASIRALLEEHHVFERMVAGDDPGLVVAVTHLDDVVRGHYRQTLRDARRGGTPPPERHVLFAARAREMEARVRRDLRHALLHSDALLDRRGGADEVASRCTRDVSVVCVTPPTHLALLGGDAEDAEGCFLRRLEDTGVSALGAELEARLRQRAIAREARLRSSVLELAQALRRARGHGPADLVRRLSAIEAAASRSTQARNPEEDEA